MQRKKEIDMYQIANSESSCVSIFIIYHKQNTILTIGICNFVFVLCDIIYKQREESIMVVIMVLAQSGLGHIDIPVHI